MRDSMDKKEAELAASVNLLFSKNDDCTDPSFNAFTSRKDHDGTLPVLAGLLFGVCCFKV